MKWTTFKEYETANEDTGEVTRHGKQPKNTVIKNKEVKFIIKENHGYKTITYWCEKDPQLKLW